MNQTNSFNFNNENTSLIDFLHSVMVELLLSLAYIYPSILLTNTILKKELIS
jgi:hypothetical protein